MKGLTFVAADQMKTLEEYAASNLAAMIYLKYMETYHVAAFKAGLFETDEEECSKTIIWEIQRLLSLYKTQNKYICDRSSFDQEAALALLKKQMPGIKIPKKRKAKKPVEEAAI